MKTFFTIFFTVAISIFTFGAPPPSSSLVISEVYGGGGNSGAPYQFDFIELYNNGTTAVSLNGLSVQYGSSAAFPSAANTIILPNFSLAPGKYYLIQLGNGGLASPAGSPLPAPDFTQTAPGTNMSNANGRVFLVNGTSPVTACNAANIIDLVGYGTATCNETSAAPAASNALSVNRTFPSADTDNNSIDFTTAAPTPRNSSFVVATSAVNNFSASKTASTSILKWATACQSSHNEFVLEKSSDGKKFNPIYAQIINQNSCNEIFNYEDLQPYNGVNYYRLKIKRNTGEIEFSEILLLKFGKFETIKLVPTLVTNNVNIFYESATESNSTWSVYDCIGNKVFSKSIPLLKGQNTITINAYSFAPGVYLVKAITNSGLTQMVNFIKQ